LPWGDLKAFQLKEAILGILRGIFLLVECYMIIKKKGWKSLIGLLKDRGKILRDSELL
jgi:hypothetical protein